MGLGVGSTVGKPDIEPTTLGPHNCCVLAYDIESEFAGPSNSKFQSAILCDSIKCTCGYQHVITRSKLIGSGLPHTVMTSNSTIAVEHVCNISAVQYIVITTSNSIDEGEKRWFTFFFRSLFITFIIVK